MSPKKNRSNWEAVRKLYREGKLVAALEAIEELVSKEGLPSKANLLYICARVYRENAEYDNALICWDQFFSIDPENSSQINALNETALCYSKSRDYHEALRVYDQLLEISPRDKYALFGKSLVLVRMNENDQAIKVLKEAVDIFPDDIRVIDQYAKVLQYSRKHDEAIELYRKTLELDPDNFFAWSGLFISYKELGRKEVKSTLERLSTLAGNNIRALDKFVRALFTEGDTKIAVEFIDTISDLNTIDTGYLRLTADVYMDYGLQTNESQYFQKAIGVLLKITSLYKTPNLTVLALIGNCYVYLNEFEKADEYYEELLRNIRPPLTNGYLKRLIHKTGDLLINTEKLDMAVKYFNVLLMDNPDNPYGLDGLARAYRFLGEYEKSIDVYERKLAQYPDDVYALDGLALAYQDNNQLDKAIGIFTRLASAHEEERNKLQNRMARIRTEKIRADIDQFNQRKLTSLSTMTSGISHELSQPLAIIRWNLSSLERDLKKKRFKEEQLEEALNTMSYQSGRINEILNAFKELSRENPLILREVDLEKTVSRTFEMFANQLKIKNISVDLSRVRRNIPKIYADELKLEQILMNLILNARDALQDRNDGLISCSTYTHGSAHQKRICLMFQDNGPGIPQEYRTRIYDPFFTTKTVGRGTGLGLSIVFQYMQDMRGSIELDGAYVNGSRFRLKFRSFRGA